MYSLFDDYASGYAPQNMVSYGTGTVHMLSSILDLEIHIEEC